MLFVQVIVPLSALGYLSLYFLPPEAKLILPILSGLGLLIYLNCCIRKSRLAVEKQQS